MSGVLKRGLQKGTRMLVEEGPGYTLDWIRYHLYERYREWQLGIETAEYRGWEAANDSSPENSVYEPVCYDCLDRVLTWLDIEPDKEVFLDYGSGKGRVVTVAATYPFREVMGIELVPELVTIAENNIRKAGKQLKCNQVNILVADVVSFSVPDNVTVFFLFNPFSGEVMRKAQENIHLSLIRNPRKIRIIYMNPISSPDPFTQCEWLNEVQAISPGWWRNMRFVVHSNRFDR